MGVSTAGDCVVDDELEKLVSSVYRRLVGLLVLRVGDMGVAEELAQESLLKLVKNWDQVRVMENPWAWLAKVAINQPSSRWRRLAIADRVQRTLVPINDAVDGHGGLAEFGNGD